MDPATTSALLKIGAALGTPLAKQAAARATFRLRVGREAALTARTHGIEIKQRAIRTWLERPDAKDALQRADEVALISASQALYLRAPGARDPIRDELLLRIVLESFVSCLPSGADTAASVAWTRSEGEQTRDEIRQATERILDRLQPARSFDELVSTFHPWRAADARHMRERVPGLMKALEILAPSHDRSQVLTDWAHSHPEWLAEDPELHAWLGRCAFEYNAAGAGEHFVNRGLELGLSPRHYWIARRELAGDTSLDALIDAQRSGSHPLLDGLVLALQGDERAAVDTLRDWDPDTDEDRAIRLQLLSRLVESLETIASALAIVEPTAEASGSSGQMLRAAELLLRRGVTGGSISRLADSERALDLAIRARNSRRSWRGESATAALMAMRAAHLSGQSDRAWSITQVAPEGEATPTEAADPRITAEAALTAAMTGRLSKAHELLGSVTSPFARSQVLALLAEQQEDPITAGRHWHEAWATAKEPNERLAAAMGLAESGQVADGLDELAANFPEKVQEIRDVAEALGASGDPRQTLRSRVHKSPRIALELAERLHATGDHDEAALVLEAAALRWNSAQLMLRAGYEFRTAGNATKAVAAAQAAINLGGGGWPGVQGARAILLECYASQGRYDLAADQGRALLIRDPHDEAAQWALVKCLLRRGTLEDAWDALTINGRPVSPRDADEALCWIGLYARYTKDPDAVSRALSEFEPWIDDERVAGAFLMELMTNAENIRVEATEDEVAAYQQALLDYQERFPASNTLRGFKLGPEDDPLANIREFLRDHYRDVTEVSAKVARMELPLGILSNAYGRLYSEICLARPWPVLSRGPSTNAVALGDESTSVVVDTTALATLARLDAETRDRLFARFASVRTTDALYLDATRAREQLELRAPLSLSWDPVELREQVSVVSDAHVEKLASRAAVLQADFERTLRAPWHELRNFDQRLPDCAWLSALDMAKEDGLPLWLDDSVLRGVAESLGVATMSTADLLNDLRKAEVLTPSEHEIAQAVLISEGYNDLGFAERPIRLAAEMAGWAPEGAALTLESPQSWHDPERVMAFYVEVLDMVAANDPQHLSGWVRSTGVGLMSIAGDAEAATDNLHVLLGRTLGHDAIGAHQMPFVLEGVRAANTVEDVRGPLEHVLSVLYIAYVEHFGHGLAAQLLMAKLSKCRPEDKTTAARVVLTSPDS